MRLSPLGPSKRAYLSLALVLLAASAGAQWLTERGRRAALGPPSKKLQMVELWPVVLGGFRGPMIAALAYYAQEKEVEADIYSTRSTIRTLIELQPEFENLWIYHSWVIAYNLTAVISPPRERYQFIRDGITFLEEGVKRIANLYEGRKKYVNDRCPVTGRRLDPARITPRLIREFEGVRVAFLDEEAIAQWEGMPELERARRLEAVRDAPLQYKRKRATLLYMVGWTYYHKLAKGKEANQYYRRWYIKETGRDPFQDAYRYLALASAVDVPPYQVSYHVIKTMPAHCLMDWARALADDERVKVDDVLTAFERVHREWDRSLPKVTNRKPIQATLKELEVMTAATWNMSQAEKMARFGDDRRARAFLTQARRRLDWLFANFPLLENKDVYNHRYELTRRHVEALLGGGEVP